MKRTTPCDLIYKVQFGMAQSHKLTLTIYLFILVFFYDYGQYVGL